MFLRAGSLSAAFVVAVASFACTGPVGDGPAAAGAVETEERAPQRTPDVPYEPSPPEVVAAMLRLAEVGPGDVVYDLGCGDGRIPIAAVAEHGAARGVCVELDPALARRAGANAREAGVGDRVEVIEGDLFEADLGAATVVTLFLYPHVNLELRPKLLRELAPGTRVVSHEHDMGDWAPEGEVRVDDHVVYLWTIPGRAAEGAPPPED